MNLMNNEYSSSTDNYSSQLDHVPIAYHDQIRVMSSSSHDRNCYEHEKHQVLNSIVKEEQSVIGIGEQPVSTLPTMNKMQGKLQYNSDSTRNPHSKPFPSSSLSPPQSTTLSQHSVKCPQYFKDSVCKDIIQCYCPSPDQKVLIVTVSIQQAKWLHKSIFLNQISELVHNGMDRRERVRRARRFQGRQLQLQPQPQSQIQGQQQSKNNQDRVQCLITNHVQTTQVRKFNQVKLIIFASPPKNNYIYTEAVNLCYEREQIVVCYNTKQITEICRLQNQLKRNFIMLSPPNVESQSGSDRDRYQYQQQKCQDQTKLTKLRQQQRQKRNQKQYKIVIRNIDPNIKQQQLKIYLAQSGVEVDKVRLVTERCPKQQYIGTKTCLIEVQGWTMFVNVMKLDGVEFGCKAIDGGNGQKRRLSVGEYLRVNSVRRENCEQLKQISN